jgi:hypothetical protein
LYAVGYFTTAGGVLVKYVAKWNGAVWSALGAVQGGGLTQISRKDYGVWDLEFSTTGTYNNFLNFTKDLESNLRIVDISSIQFSSASSSDINTKINLPANSPSSSEVYRYGFKIKTYWLKN